MSAKTAKKITENIRARNSTSTEVTLFAEVLGDEEHNFAAAFEELALKSKQCSKQLSFYTYPKNIWPKT